LRHGEELTEDRCAKVRQWHLEPRPVGCLHRAVALAGERRRRRAAAIAGGACRARLPNLMQCEPNKTSHTKITPKLY
jgi:hypothetical protein